jgi:hypothetical protein
MAEGDWKHLGELLDRHRQLNQILDPQAAAALRAALAHDTPEQGAFVPYCIAQEGLRVTTNNEAP